MKHLTLLLLLGCGSDLAPTSSVTKARLIGVEVTVADDRERSTPMVEEDFRAKLLFAFPAADEPVSWFVVVCPGAPSTIGAGFCGSGTLASASHPTPSTEPAIAELDLPRATLDEPADLLLVGGFCAGGVVRTADPSELTSDGLSSAQACEDSNLTGSFFTAELPIQREPVDENRRPMIDPILDGSPWEDTDGDCSSGILPTVSPASITEIGIASRGDTHERYVERTDDGDEERVEEFQISNLSNGGEFARSFVFVNENAPLATVEFTAPPISKRLEFHFVARDGRGGVRRVRRSLCVQP
ncbi:MAG: hypothetical protein AAGF12_24105 [Myxococcota bacterium]